MEIGGRNGTESMQEFFENIRNITFTEATEPTPFSVFSSAIFYVLIAGVSGFLILSATILCFTYWFYVKRKTSPVLEGSLSDLSFHVHANGETIVDEEKEFAASPKAVCNIPAEETSLIEPPSWSVMDVNKLKSYFTDITVSEQSVERCKALQEGTFCAIYLGLFHKPPNYGNANGKPQNNAAGSGPPRKAFIKTVIRQATQVQVATMLHDALLLKGVVHKHLMSPVAVAFAQPGSFPQFVYPSASYGNLKKVLTVAKWPNSVRGAMSDSNHQNLIFSVRNLIEIATQVLKAIRHLHRVGIVHKDIAARNCFLTTGTDGMRVRLCDPCLSRDLFPDEYHCLLDNENRPVRWLALEAIEEKLYSRASDVWAFAVFLWELFTLGQMPYVDVDPFEMATVLADGLRVQKPPNCPDHIYSLMVCCWLIQPEQRPTIDKINDFLQAYIAQSPL